MPIYQFKCLNCGALFEFFKIRSDDKVKCESCGETKEKKLKQQVSKSTSFQLKGRGWYKDGY